MDNKQSRLRSWPLWLAMSALVVWVIKTIWKVDISKEANDFMNVLLPVLVGFGIINNPTDGDHI